MITSLMGKSGLILRPLSLLRSTKCAEAKKPSEEYCPNPLQCVILFTSFCVNHVSLGPTLGNLFGYCNEREEEGVRGLVFEYVSNENLHDKLHVETSTTFLPWPRWIAIAYQIASVMEYLHEICNPPIIHYNVTSSNILLDKNYNEKLCDFGISKTGDKNLICKNSCVMGSPGYFDLHCFKSGIISEKNDVYSFGVLHLELITGMEAVCGEKRELLAAFASRS